MQKQVTLAPRKKATICQGRPSWKERLQNSLEIQGRDQDTIRGEEAGRRDKYECVPRVSNPDPPLPWAPYVLSAPSKLPCSQEAGVDDGKCHTLR